MVFSIKKMNMNMGMDMNNMFMNPMFPMQMKQGFPMPQPNFQPMMQAMSQINPKNSVNMNFLLEILRDYIIFLQDYLRFFLKMKNYNSIDFKKENINIMIQKIENFSSRLKLMSFANINMPNSLGINEIIIIIEQLLRELIVRNNQKNNYFEVNEIQLRNDNIVFKIEKKIFELLNKNEYELETVGKFLYSLGGIARKSLSISNQIFHEYLEEFKKKNLINNNNNPHETRKNFSIFVKNNLNENYFEKCYKRNIMKIMKYLEICPDESEFLIDLFNDMLQLYFICALICPNIVEIKFCNFKNKEFISDEMTDLIYKGKPTKVNFCYLPQLKSNGAVLNGGKFYVFTYIVEGKKTFKQEEIDYEEVEQNLMN